MQVCKYAHMQEFKYVSMFWYMYSGIQVCKYANVQLCLDVCMHVYINP
jgi:hypothetical protein